MVAAYRESAFLFTCGLQIIPRLQKLQIHASARPFRITATKHKHGPLVMTIESTCLLSRPLGACSGRKTYLVSSICRLSLNHEAFNMREHLVCTHCQDFSSTSAPSQYCIVTARQIVPRLRGTRIPVTDVRSATRMPTENVLQKLVKT